MTTNLPKRENQRSKLTLAATPTQARQTKQQFANSNSYLSFELGKAVQALRALYTRLLAGSISLAHFWSDYLGKFRQNRPGRGCSRKNGTF